MIDLAVEHNSHSLFYRNPFGAVTCGQKVIFRLKTRAPHPVKECFLRVWEKGEEERLLPMVIRPETGDTDPLEQVFTVEYPAPDDPGLVWYCFIIKTERQTWFYGNNKELSGGEGELKTSLPPSYQLTVYRTAGKALAWYQQGVMYQIFVDRFANGNEQGLVCHPKPKSLIHGDWNDTPFYLKDAKGRVTRWTFFGGNLAGVMQKLPYLRELGISAIYFNPVFASASNHKYDTGDYLKIDPMYGDEEIFACLIREAGKYGIAVILDGVFSHTGSDSIYFNKKGSYPSLGAFQSPDSPYFNWYRFSGSREKYDCWWGVEDLPNVNENEPSYRDFILTGENSVVKYWMRKGIKGWRLDVADELPDEFIKTLRQTMAETDPDAVLIGEVWEDASNKISYGKLREYLWGEELDGTTNYPFRSIFLDYLLGKSDAFTAHRRIMSLYENYPREHFYRAMNLLGSHDTIRIMTLLGEAPPAESLSEIERENFRLPREARELAVKRLRLFSLVQMAFPGVPCIYYGDEAGAEGYADPYNRGTYPWGREDRELLDWYRKIVKIRREYQVLQTGEFASLPGDQDVYGFRRADKNEEIILVINPSLCLEKEILIRFALPEEGLRVEAAGKSGEKAWVALELLSGEQIPNAAGGFLARLKPLEGKLFYCRERDVSLVPRLERSCGVLLHLTSLPSRWGIGDLGETAFRFAGFLAEAGQSLWQILPLNPVGPGFSPFQSDSAFAGNPLLISIDCLIKEGLLAAKEAERELESMAPFFADTQVNFPAVFELKEKLLRRAFEFFQVKIDQARWETPAENRQGYLSWPNYSRFLAENNCWLEDYCLYQALKKYHGGLPWQEWEKNAACRDRETLAKFRKALAGEIAYQQFLQYIFFTQWANLRSYARAQGISFIGDLPIYVAADSCDTWVHRELFELDEAGWPLKVGGVPPDYFSQDGQLWGNPLYNWNKMASEKFSWWTERIRQALQLTDYLRLDHFRGFEAYWEIPESASTAAQGRWIKGPGKEFFAAMARELGSLPLIAEDLGMITPEVKVLKEIFGFPGMKVLQFLTAESLDQKRQSEQEVYYTGTHDNDTLWGWYQKNIIAGLRPQYLDPQTVCRDFITTVYNSKSAWVIIPLQDILGLDSRARMNTPGTAAGNWGFRMPEGSLTAEIVSFLKEASLQSGRAAVTST
ncbi:MAG: bifunctional glycogen debranching protein GlgX/4-alpha-glucanotransferase [Syntrophomonadaceae bacterium]|nr:bifunctional glycogen debranching protein GlgX/4-alpha-glucanotransferase [Syntrophomonadaceae bacterium]